MLPWVAELDTANDVCKLSRATLGVPRPEPSTRACRVPGAVKVASFNLPHLHILLTSDSLSDAVRFPFVIFET